MKRILKIFYFSLVFTLVLVSATWARQKTVEAGNEKASVAKIYFTGKLEREGQGCYECPENEGCKPSIIIDASSVKKPGDSMTINFGIKNNENNECSDVSLVYNLHIFTTDNLPLSYELKNQEGEVIWHYLSNTNNNGLVLERSKKEDALCGDFSAGILEEDRYSLKITWEGANKDCKYAGLIEYIEINADARQVD